METVVNLIAPPLRAKSVQFGNVQIKLTSSLPKRLATSIRTYLNQSNKTFDYSSESLRVVQRGFIQDNIAELEKVIQAIQDERDMADSIWAALHGEKTSHDAPEVSKAAVLFKLYETIKGMGVDTGDSLSQFDPETLPTNQGVRIWQPLQDAIVACHQFMRLLDRAIEDGQAALDRTQEATKAFDARICSHSTDIHWLEKEGYIDNLPQHWDRPIAGIVYGKALDIPKDDLKWIRPDAEGNRNATLLLHRWKQADAIVASRKKADALRTLKRKQEEKLLNIRRKFTEIILKGK